MPGGVKPSWFRQISDMDNQCNHRVYCLTTGWFSSRRQYKGATTELRKSCVLYQSFEEERWGGGGHLSMRHCKAMVFTVILLTAQLSSYL